MLRRKGARVQTLALHEVYAHRSHAYVQSVFLCVIIIGCICLSHIVSLPFMPCYLCSLLQMCTCLRCVTSCLSLLLPPVRCLYVFSFSLLFLISVRYILCAKCKTFQLLWQKKPHQCWIHTFGVKSVFLWWRTFRLNIQKCGHVRLLKASRLCFY